MGQIIAGLYEIEEKLGAGGGAIVYKGRHLRLNKSIVLKADKRSLTVGQDALRREVDMLKGLSNSYIPQVYDFVEQDGIVYTVMEFVEGQSFQELLKQGYVAEQPYIVKWACQLLEALNYLHTRPPYGILHADIKPANIMLRPNGDICLIDYNIALALGQNGAVRVGYSKGYASPEHYGISYIAIKGGAGERVTYREATEQDYIDADTARNQTTERTVRGSKRFRTDIKDETTGIHKTILLDVRSDIYSLGATLYHLLSGQRPPIAAPDVSPLSSDICSPLIASILQKAMDPLPENRFCSAAEMLQAFLDIYKNDPRTVRHKRRMRSTFAILTAMFLAGGGVSFVGMQQIQNHQRYLTLAEYSANSLAKGDVNSAINQALEAIPQNKSILNGPVTGEAVSALTSALGVYNLADTFQPLASLGLPSVPFQVIRSPEQTRFAVTYAYSVAVYDMATRTKIVEMPIMESAFADVVFLDENTIIYAGKEGITAYDLQNSEVLWTGSKATTISVSGDKSTVAAVYGDEDKFYIYDTETGAQRVESFDGKHLHMPANAILTNAKDDVFSLNSDGSMLAVSYADGGFRILNLKDRENDAILMDESDYDHFEGGFAGKYVVLGSSNRAENKGYLSIIDTEEMTEVSSQEYDHSISVRPEGDSIYLATDHLLEDVDLNRDPLEQELAYIDEANINAFSVDDEYSLVSTDNNEIHFYDKTAKPINVISVDHSFDMVSLLGDYSLLANRDETALRILHMENHKDAEFASYDVKCDHTEARVSQDEKSIVLFNTKSFSIYDREGECIERQDLPDSEKIYDQQFRRDESGSYLEVIWYDGRHRFYSATDGTLIKEEQQEKPDESLYEEFLTSKYRFTSELGKAAEVYNLKNGKKVMSLPQEAYLTYVTEAGDYIVVQYVIMSENGDRDKTAILMNQQLETVAVLPDLCDVYNDTLYFDYMSGHIKKSRIYSVDELVKLGMDRNQQ